MTANRCRNDATWTKHCPRIPPYYRTDLCDEHVYETNDGEPFVPLVLIADEYGYVSYFRCDYW